jgi:peptidoglycan/xylan/chitin deacetylase (PgdA/CDA1 family)
MIWTNPSILGCVFPWILWKGPAWSTDVFLTFDDGPHPEYTPRVLEILKRERIAGTFFLNGRNVLLHPGVTERIRFEGHVIGNHGFSHSRLDWKNAGFILSEIAGTDDAIRRAAGRSPVFFRPPYGRFDPRFRKWMVESGHRLVLWSLLAGDFLDIRPDALIERVRRSARPGAIVVLHDGHPNAPAMIAALPEIIRGLRNAGFTFKPLDALLAKPTG